jgi:proline dehydrogenase
MTYVAKSKSAILNPDQNRLLGVLMRTLFYNHFCAGKNDAEVKKTVTAMKNMGFKGVILGYAKEVLVDPAASREEVAASGLAEPKDKAIDEWREGNLRTLPMIGSGDFLAIK